MKTQKLLTIQDISCYGQCSLTVALPIISAMGIETCILPSAVLSTHTGGFQGYTFRDLTDDMPAIVNHWRKIGITFDAFYTGYIGNVKQLDIIADIFRTMRNNDSRIIIDPVMGDCGKLYCGFDQDFAYKMAKLCASADVIIPNLTEAGYLLGEPYIGDTSYDKSTIEALLVRLSKLGAKTTILTGVSFSPDKLGIAAYDRVSQKFFYCFNDRIKGNYAGTGDIFASSFCGGILRGLSTEQAAKLAVNFTVESVKRTVSDKEHWYGVKFEQTIPYLLSELATLL